MSHCSKSASVGWARSCGHLSDGERVASFCRARTRSGEPVGELVNYENSYWLWYVRGPGGIIVELAEKIG